MKSFISTISLVAILALAAPVVGTAATAKFEVDPSHSKVLFKVRHLGISTVTGQFKNFSASFDLDPSDLSTLKAKAVIDVASVDTEVEERDNHLRSGDFFDAENHPEMKFVSTKAEVVGDNKVELHGNLTIRGVTKPVVLDAVYGGAVQDPWGNYRSAFSASGTINRKDFGVNWNKVLDTGGLVVGDEVQLELELEAIRQDESSD